MVKDSRIIKSADALGRFLVDGMQPGYGNVYTIFGNGEVTDTCMR